MYMHTYTYAHTHTHIHTYTHTYMYMHTYTPTHTHRCYLDQTCVPIPNSLLVQHLNKGKKGVWYLGGVST